MTKGEFIEEPKIPLTFAIAEAKAAINSAINQVERKYSLPSFILEGVIAEIYAEVIANSKSEMLQDFNEYAEAIRNSYNKQLEKNLNQEKVEEETDG